MTEDQKTNSQDTETIFVHKIHMKNLMYNLGAFPEGKEHYKNFITGIEGVYAFYMADTESNQVKMHRLSLHAHHTSHATDKMKDDIDEVLTYDSNFAKPLKMNAAWVVKLMADTKVETVTALTPAEADAIIESWQENADSE